VLVHLAETFALHGKAMRDDMRIADNSIFIVRCGIDDAQQQGVPQDSGYVARRHLKAGRKIPVASEAVPVRHAFAHRRAPDILKRYHAAGMLRR
jgi:hypothetical protein